ncbi:DUF1365 domain-containing protein [Streptomyces pathocidini]|uniref:DUF1365 domain-containing protein n=1 Tax=Streptomyces pathocidini TaxID=1650571 RepID=UPI0033ED26B8
MTPEHATRNRSSATAGIRTPVLFDCEVVHHRHEDADHRFSHRLRLWLVDVSAPPAPRAPLSWLLRFRAADHLGDPARTLRENIGHFLLLNGVDTAGGRVLMLAQARALGYVFDPVTLYWCHDRHGRLAAVVAEVRNTFGERHCYLVRPDGEGRAEADKHFYVSPLFPVDGRYLMRFRLEQDRLAVTFVLRRPDEAALRRPEAAKVPGKPAVPGAARDHTALVATLRGVPVEPRARRLGALLAHPLASYRTITLVHYRSWRLRRLGLRVRRRRFHPPQPGVGPGPTGAPRPRRRQSGGD